MSGAVKQIVIVGAGLTGLTSAYYLQKEIEQKNLPYQITLIEKSNRLGGKVVTEQWDGFTIEKGPDSFLANKGSAIELIYELGLEEDLVGTNPLAKKNYILHRNRLHLMPPGLLLGIPTQLGPFIKTGLISPIGKLRAALDLLIPRKVGMGDESLGGFLQRRLGKEVAENIAEPLLSGIYAGDTQNLSLLATFPQFQALEKKYGSLIKGMLLSRKNSGQAKEESKMPKELRRSMFLSFRNGLHSLVQELVKQLKQVEILKEQSIDRIDRDARGYVMKMGNIIKRADAIILAVPTFAVKDYLPQLECNHLLSEIPYVSVANVALAYNRKDIQHPLDGSGFLVPRKEKRYITACTWTSSKWLHTAPQDKVLLRCYVGHSKDESLLEESDESLIEKVQQDIKEIMGVHASPHFYRVTRWRESMPQYQVGHKRRVHELVTQLKEHRPGIVLAGSGYHGVGIPDCIQQGRDAADQILKFLTPGGL